ncbi:MAG: efflux RND transporter periplasmic adaptor subunit [Verrucomicrobia bacterium]|nr:efflux RND transporter periplasmic adaptor subunit [Verrucomicrobiota bacterium]MDE3099097.1 efflux RND transporter periplasmic adaptor subunit [Verrucomicrobiota bacterium]
MKPRRKFPWIVLILAVVAAGTFYAVTRPPPRLVLTGVVTTDEVIVGSQIQGRVQRLMAQVGDTVTNGQLLALLQSDTERADAAFYEATVRQAEASVAAARADLENDRLAFERATNLFAAHSESAQGYDAARTVYEAGQARLASLKQEVRAAAAQEDKAQVLLGYTKIVSPTNGIVDTRVTLAGEEVVPGQAIVTLINPNDLWVRADVPETYIDKLRPGETLRIALPSGAVREGTIFYRGVDAGYATQRDVSRTKRDIKTFEIRLRCNNRDRSLAVGMTAYVTLPFPP